MHSPCPEHQPLIYMMHNEGISKNPNPLSGAPHPNHLESPYPGTNSTGIEGPLTLDPSRCLRRASCSPSPPCRLLTQTLVAGLPSTGPRGAARRECYSRQRNAQRGPARNEKGTFRDAHAKLHITTKEMISKQETEDKRKDCLWTLIYKALIDTLWSCCNWPYVVLLFKYAVWWWANPLTGTAM